MAPSQSLKLFPNSTPGLHSRNQVSGLRRTPLQKLEKVKNLFLLAATW